MNAPDVQADGATPSGVPDGWVLHTSYDPACGFYVPSSTSVLPPPIAWRPCDSAAQPSGVTCEQMTVTWTAPSAWAVGTMLNAGWLSASGTYIMAIGRAMVGMTMYVVADSDGPVHSALLATNETRCRPFPADLRDGRIVYQVFEADASGHLSAYGGGALTAGIDDLQPTAYLRFHDQIARSYLVGLPGVLEVQTAPSKLIVHSWTDPSQTSLTWSAGQDNNLQLVAQAFQSSTLHWEAVGAPIVKEKIWTGDAGPADWIAFDADASQGAGDLGTDGTDMVWLQGSGGAPAGVFADAAFMTAPYTTDPTAVQPRRLRSEDPSGLGASLTQVGCGYAARFFKGGIRIVRLSDGTSWVLPSQSTAQPWNWQNPLAVTCTHVYASVQEISEAGTPYTTVARVRLDSLGAGIPAD